MPKINEINRLSAEQAEELRTEIGVTQRFIQDALGLGQGTYSYWITQREAIPEKHQANIIDLFISLKHLKDGRKMLPLDEGGNVETPNRQVIRDATEVVDVIWRELEPRLDNNIIKRSHKNMVNELKEELSRLL